jgi:hypothetical protein
VTKQSSGALNIEVKSQGAASIGVAGEFEKGPCEYTAPEGLDVDGLGGFRNRNDNRFSSYSDVKAQPLSEIGAPSDNDYSFTH